MKFNYKPILSEAPCFALIKNLRYENDNPLLPIKKGEIIQLSTNKSDLYKFIPKPDGNFKTARQIKRFLFRAGIILEYNTEFKGEELLKQIDLDSTLYEEFSFKPGKKISELLELVKEYNWITEDKLYYNYSGSAYHDDCKLRDYQLFDETYDIRFFAGADKEKTYQFVLKYIHSRLALNKPISGILSVVQSDFMESMDNYSGVENFSGYDCWEYLNYRLRNEPIPGIKKCIDSDWDFVDYMGDK
jgi:hypothetical protein